MDNDSAELIHRYIILELTMRTLEREKKFTSDLKMQRVFNQWFEVKIDELFTELKSVRAEMLKRGIKVQSENVTDNATEYLIIERGTTFKRQYFNVALRNWCEEEVKRLLGLEYRQPSDRK